MAGHAPGAAGNPLANEDLLPTTPAQRHWGWKDFAALWVGMVVCVPTYTMASSMLDQGFTWQMAVWLVFLANCIVLIPMVLIGRVGPKYGVPFPVLARASFGVKGPTCRPCCAAWWRAAGSPSTATSVRWRSTAS